MKQTKTEKPQSLRAVMEKRFKINDGSSKYVEQATLLEPANNNASSQNEIEELREVSNQLQAIKKKHDEEKKAGNEKQAELEKVKKEIEHLYQAELKVEGPQVDMECQLDDLKNELAAAREKTAEEEFAKYTYLHMLDRMKKDFIASKLNSSSAEISLKNKSTVLDLEQQKSRKIKEERLQSKQIFENLLKNIEKEQHERAEIIEELKKCIKNKEESVQKRIDRQKRNQEIAEAAANENKDQTEVKSRESLYIQKLWNAFMRKKMEKEMKNSAKIDEAFKIIKTETGITNVQEIVKKFLTREQTYSSLLSNVSESENKIDILKKDNELLSSRLHLFKIDGNNPQQNGQWEDEMIIEMQNKISQQKKDMIILQDKFKKVNIVNDQILGWAKRVYSKFGDLTKNESVRSPADDLVRMFNGMAQITVSELTQLKERGEEPMENEDAFGEFQQADFLSKNIRVRPTSGVTHMDETKDGRASTVSKGTGEETKDNAEHHHLVAVGDLQEDRKNLKMKRALYEEELRRRQALEEKKLQKK